MFDSIRRCESRIPPDSLCFIFLVLSLCLRKQRVKGLWKGTQTTWKNTFENQTNTFEDFDKHFCQIRQTLLIFLASVTVLEKTMGEWKGTQTTSKETFFINHNMLNVSKPVALTIGIYTICPITISCQTFSHKTKVFKVFSKVEVTEKLQADANNKKILIYINL